jgi:hypothetical protein
MALLLKEYRSKRVKTRHTRTVFLASFLLAAAAPAAAQPVLDCGTRSLAEAVGRIHDGDRVIRFTGVCTGPVVIGTERVTLQSVGSAVIDGEGANAVTIAGARAAVPVRRTPTNLVSLVLSKHLIPCILSM